LFEAILAAGKMMNQEQDNNKSITFSAKIDELERDELTLSGEL